MPRNPFAIAFLGCLVATVARSEPPRKVATVEGFTEYRLANGLRVLLCPDGSRPRVTVNLTVFAGSRHEGYGETGMAHLVEHLLCRGMTTRPDFPRILKERGAQWNASTWLDCTNYCETLPATDDNVAFAIQLEADRFVNGLMRGQDLATEMPVVRNEFESGEDDPEYILEQRMMASAFVFHNYGKPEIGNRADIEGVPIDRIRAFYRARYRPDNAMLIVTGRFDSSKALDQVMKAFGHLTSPDSPLDRTYTEEPPQDGERSVTLRRVGDVGAVGLLYHVPAGPHADFAAVQVLGEMLAASPSGRLHAALVESGKASNVNGRASAWHDPGVMRLMARVARGKSRDDVRRTMLDVVEKVGESAIPAEEVDRARQRLLRDRDQILDNPYPARLAIELSNWSAKGDWRLFFLHRDRLEAVTPEAVRDVAARYLRTSNRTVGLFEPTEKPDRTPIPGTPDLAPMVDRYQGQGIGPSAEPFDVDPNALAARIVLPRPIGGIKLAILPRKTTNHEMMIHVNLRYGNAESLRGKVEASRLLPELMTRGTGRQIRDVLDLNRSQITAVGAPGLVGLTIETRRPAMPAMLDLLRRVLREPTLPAEEFAILKGEELARLEEWRSSPGRLASNRLDRMLSDYPPDDVRFLPSIDERIARIKTTNLDQIKSLYENEIGLGAGELVIVGDIEPNQVIEALTRMFDGWKSARPYSRIERPFQTGIKPDRQSIATPDRANAVYFAGLLLPIGEDHSDYPSLVVANLILGGSDYDNRGFKDETPDPFKGRAPFAAGVSSRLVDRLRHRGGLSYGSASFFAANVLDGSSRLILYANTSPGKIPEVEAAAAEELRRWVDHGITADELDRARAEYFFAREVERSDNEALASLIARQVREGRTMKSVANLEAAIRRLTAEEVSKAIRRHVDPARLSTVTAGDFGPR